MVMAIGRVYEDKMRLIKEFRFGSKAEALNWAQKEAERTTAKRSGKTMIKKRRTIKVEITETLTFHT